MFEIEPLSGRMESMGAQVMMVKLNAAHPCILNEVIEIEYESGEKWYQINLLSLVLILFF